MRRVAGWRAGDVAFVAVVINFFFYLSFQSPASRTRPCCLCAAPASPRRPARRRSAAPAPPAERRGAPWPPRRPPRLPPPRRSAPAGRCTRCPRTSWASWTRTSARRCCSARASTSPPSSRACSPSWTTSPTGAARLRKAAAAASTRAALGALPVRGVVAPPPRDHLQGVGMTVSHTTARRVAWQRAAWRRGERVGVAPCATGALNSTPPRTL